MTGEERLQVSGSGLQRSAVRYLVMEHLEGTTLAARIERGAVPLDEAVQRRAGLPPRLV